ncbi:glycosyltransferase family 4 protein [Rhizobiales bacterium TNE-4]|nr:glycosyltransferase family 4 protein [Rhizobiales bacterium TNE-4]MBV1827569.1 glycosyltransferase family 4 protein [Rhizobiales bacterium TNE-4]
MPTILHVINDVDYWFMHREPLAQAARLSGYDVVLAAPPHQNLRKAEKLGYKVIELEIDRFRLCWSDAVLFFRLRRLLCDNQFDLVHLFTIKPILFGGLALASLKKSRRSKAIATVAGLGRAFKTGLIQRLVLVSALRYGVGQTADFITFENPDDRNRYITSGIVKPSAAKFLKGAGVNTKVFYPSMTRQSSGKVNFLFAGRMLKSKGILQYLTAASLLGKKHAGCAFFVAGLPSQNEPDAVTNDELEPFKRLTFINWLGAVKQEEMPDLLRKMDVFVLPTQYQEGLPRSCLEAGACALAVIAGDVEGTRYLIEDGQTGLLVQSGGADNLSLAMERLYLSPDTREYLGKNLHAKISNEGFDSDTIFGQFIKLYKATIRFG